MKSSAVFEFDASRCERCGLCVDDCLTQALVKGSDGFPTLAPDAETRCFRCRHCFAICPTGAIRRFGNDPDESEPIAQIPEPEAELALMRARRSVRAYLREDVDSEIVERLHDAASYAPSGCNDRGLFFSYSDSLATTDGFREAARQAALRAIENADALPERLAYLPKLRAKLEQGQDVFFRNAPCFVAVAADPKTRDAHIDPYVAAAHFELLANCYGLGTCWGGMATDLFLSDADLLAHLNLPQGQELKTIVMFGRPDVRYARAARPDPYPRTRVLPF